MANITSIEALLIKHQLRWAGHLVRMPEKRLPKQIFYSELSSGTRKRGRQKKRFKDTLTENIKACGIDLKNWEQEAGDRNTWRSMVTAGVEKFENKRRQHQEELRTARHLRRDQPRLQLPGNNTCPTCGRTCNAKIGLISHLKTHQRI